MGTRQKQAIFMTLHDTHPKWDKEIKPMLQQLADGKIPSNKLIDLLLHFHEGFCYKGNQQHHRHKLPPTNLRTLEFLYIKELVPLVKGLSKFLLSYKPGNIPLVLSHSEAKNSYKKMDLFYLVVLMFLGLVPRQGYHLSSSMEFHQQNSFGHILSYSEFKTICIVEYLKDTLKTIFQENIQKEQFLIFRTFTKGDMDELISKHKNTLLTRLFIESDKTSIEEFNGQLKVDFANRFIGGGCLSYGCVQEEIMFALRPQLYATTLLCEKMDHNQALAFSGFRRYFNSRGYGEKTTFDGKAHQVYKLYQSNGVKVYDENIVAIDAIKFKREDPRQFSRDAIDRQIKKAFTGFNLYEKHLKVVTGGWGCGAFNGDFTTKVIIQWIAASMADKEIVICPFGRKIHLERIHLIDRLKGQSVSEVYRQLVEAGKVKAFRPNEDILDIMMNLRKHKM